MRLARALGLIGRTMIAAGVLLLLFVAYQLWGTGIHTALAQDQLGDEFRSQLQGLADEAVGATAAPPASAPDETTPPVSYEVSPAAADVPAPTKGDSVGQIVIPRIGVDFFVIEGVDLYLLDEGPGHFPTTPMPGQPGNAAIAGHRTTFLAPFNRIDELQPGDTIDVTTLQGTFQYAVLAQDDGSGHRIVSPSALDILDDKGDDRLTLMACHPKYSAAQRIVVEAELTSPAAPATPPPTTEPTDELPTEEVAEPQGLLLDNDDSARAPAIAFSVAAGLVWLAAWLVARRWSAWRSWRWWLTYVAFGIPFFVLLYGAFENINNLLPAAY